MVKRKFAKLVFVLTFIFGLSFLFTGIQVHAQGLETESPTDDSEISSNDESHTYQEPLPSPIESQSNNTSGSSMESQGQQDGNSREPSSESNHQSGGEEPSSDDDDPDPREVTETEPPEGNTDTSPEPEARTDSEDKAGTGSEAEGEAGSEAEEGTNSESEPGTVSEPEAETGSGVEGETGSETEEKTVSESEEADSEPKEKTESESNGETGSEVEEGTNSESKAGIDSEPEEEEPVPETGGEATPENEEEPVPEAERETGSETNETTEDETTEPTENLNTLAAQEPAAEEEENEEADSNTHRFPSLTIGADPSERNFTWYSNNEDQGYFEIAVANEEGDFTDSQIIEGTTYSENNTHSPLNSGMENLSNTQVQITGLDNDTAYMYRFWNGDGEKSEVYQFNTHAPGDFSFIAVGDAQLGSSGDLESDVEGWEETVSKFPEVNEDPNFVLSVGDQVEMPWRESEYSGFIEQEGLNEYTLVPTIGNHDTLSPAFSEHFALPNVQEEGQTEAGSNYYFTYNDALFTVLNLENTNYEEHEATLQHAIEETSDLGLTWRIAVFHRSLYSPANHSDSQATEDRRENMAPLMNKYGIDLVLSGHDHSYARSHVMDGTTPKVEWDENGNAPTTYVDPEGVIYLTLNSSSGSKYYDLVENHDYLAVRNQEYTPNLSNVEVTDDTIEVVTYRTDDLSVVDRVRIVKTENNEDNLSIRSIPETQQVVTFQNGEVPAAADGIKNADTLPENTTFEWVTQPDTSDLGRSNHTVQVTYSDGSTEVVPVQAVVIEERDINLEDQEFGNMQPLEPTDNSIDISVITDTHVLPNELISDHPEYLKMLNSERKMFTQSEEALQEAVRLIEENGSEIIFVPGDITRDNERASYELFVEAVTEFVQGGEDRRVFVVPGNHDINNPAGFDYNTGGEPENLSFFKPAEFMEVFGPLVYDQAIALYKDSDEFNTYLEEVNHTYDRAEEDQYYANGYLTYVSRFDMNDEGKNGVTVLGIDAAIYSADVTNSGLDVRETGGIVTEPQMSWLVDQINDAHSRNDVVVALSHFAFLPHFPDQASLLDEFILRNWNQPYESDHAQVNGKTPMEVLADNGVAYLFTGHMHANDIASFTTDEGNTLYDIETGSLVSPGVPVRHMELTNQIDSENARHVLDIETELMETIEYLNENKDVVELDDFPEYSKDFLIDADYIAAFLMDILSQIPETKDLVASLVLPEGTPSEAVTPALIQLVKENLGTAENPAVDTEIIAGIDASIYWGDVTNGDGEKLAIDVDGPLFTDANLMITEENLALFLDELFYTIDSEVTQNEEQLYEWAKNLGQSLLDYVVVEDENGDPKTLLDLAEASYIGHLLGEEQQPGWVTDSIQRLNNENVLHDAVANQVGPELLDTISEMLNAVTFDIGENLETDGFDLGGSIAIGVISPFLPSNLEDVVDLIIDDYQVVLQDLLDSDFVANELNVYNPMLADLVTNFNNELANNQAHFAYLYDNNTTIAKQLDPVVHNGQIIFTGPNAFQFVHDFDPAQIENAYVFVNGSSVPFASNNGFSNFTLADNLANQNRVAVRVIYPNQLGNLITLTSPVAVYMEEETFEEVPFETTYVYSPSVAEGEKVLFPGQTGTNVFTDVVTQDENGNEMNRIQLSADGEITEAPMDRIIAIPVPEEDNSDVQELLNRITDLETSVNELSDENAQLLDRISELENSVNESSNENAELLDRISDLETSMNELSNQDVELQDLISELREGNTELLNRISGLEDSVSDLRSESSDLRNLIEEAMNNDSDHADHGDLEKAITDLQVEMDELRALMETLLNENDSDDQVPNDDSDETPSEDNGGNEDGENKELIRINPEVDNNKVTIVDELLQEIANDGRIVIDLEDSTQPLLEVELSSEQISTMKDKNATLIIEKEDVSIEVPSSVFPNGNEEVTITMEKLAEVENSLSEVYDFSIKQGDAVISEFDELITLEFEVDTDQINNADHLNVFNLNEENGVWEVIGGQYADGVVTAETNHFSIFTVFETTNNEVPTTDYDSSVDKNDSRDDIQENVEDKIVEIPSQDNSNNGNQNAPSPEGKIDFNTDDVKVKNISAVNNEGDKVFSPSEAAGQGEMPTANEGNGEGERLPDTATSTWNLLVIGLISVMGGIAIVLAGRKRKMQ